GRIDRFQVMRFTSWEGKATATTPYTYKLTPESIRRANEQDITADHITTFLKRIINNAPLPASVAKLLMPPSTSAVSSVTLERVLVLRTTSLEVMNFILETPATRRYLGARLGDLAVVVR
ncbi:MAG TPA: helicase-associated domain-containing protein, partial [Aggregatilineales bacterium]|nr:helicase-associated domain-containing protein [Aggregatilineales bacterium]